ncbi:MAG: hypothetical protein COB02_02975 [Candidatus Cloacimonadota bacterium]|nr:MAG: hypothetical protein COB02_02975 [Candidatus Cloacimonadota bacterium]
MKSPQFLYFFVFFCLSLVVNYSASWSVDEVNPYEIARQENVAVVNGKIYLFGGYGINSSVVGNMYIFDPNASGTKWQIGDSNTSKSRQNAGSTSCENGNIYISGGQSNTAALSDTLIYDPDVSSGSRWITSVSIPNLPYLLAGPRSVCINNVLYVTGGIAWGGTSSYNTLHYIDVTNPVTWTTVTMGVTRWNHTATLVGTDIYLTGGVSGDSGSPIQSIVDVFDTLTNTISTKVVANLNIPKYGHSSVYNPADGRIYNWGGFHYDNQVDVLDIISGTWISGAVPDLSLTYMSLSASLINDKIYFKGGWTGSVVNRMDVLTLDTFDGGSGGGNGNTSGTPDYIVKFDSNGGLEESGMFQKNGYIGNGIIDPLESFDTDGAIKIADTTSNNEGTIKFTGTDLEGYVNGEWKSLTASGVNNPVTAPTIWSENASNEAYRENYNVGIGTSDPSYRLEVNSDTTNNVAKFTSNTNTSYVRVENSAGSIQIGAQDGDFVQNVGGIERIRIKSDGKVGIGTLTPTEQLSVEGAINLKNTSTNNAGTIRYSNNDFEGYDGSTWKSLTQTSPVTNTNVWSLNGSDTFYDGGNVGIGTNSPFSKISYGSNGTLDNESNRLALFEDSLGKEFYGLGLVSQGNTSGLGFWGGTGAVTPYDGNSGTRAQMVLDKNGVITFEGRANFKSKLGLSFESPFSKISYGSNGSVNNESNRLALFEDSLGKEFFGFGLAQIGVNPGVGIWGGTGGSIPFNGTSGKMPDLFISKLSGNVGIGTTTTPTERLEVVGNIKASGFVQLGLTTGTPTVACTSATHHGRMLVDPTATPALLWICGSAGWISK